jgi:mannose-6-phosphate isomerase-like protein (cupin superfamily)
VPIYRRETLAARLPWVELDDFETFPMDPRDHTARHALTRGGGRERVIVLSGEVAAEWAGGRISLRRNDWLELPADGAVRLQALMPAELMRVAGRWRDVSVLTIFRVRPDTAFDTHYHDCDEYWLFYRGRGTALSEGITYSVGPGDVIATGMGHEHGFEPVTEIVEAIALEGAMEGAGRRGHLHRDEHGDPVPMRPLGPVAAR